MASTWTLLLSLAAAQVALALTSNPTGQPPNCTGNAFRCLDGGKCIDRALLCDGSRHCPDGSDEAQCVKKCEEDEFRCTVQHDCIPMEWRCDGTVECNDGTDEQNCTEAEIESDHGCDDDEFRCRNGFCILKSWVCNNHDDCFDNSDEEFCTAKSETVCEEGLFACNDTENSCLAPRWVCDGERDCMNGKDEENCNQAPVCKLEQNNFLCHDNATCISLDKVCNNVQDCPDGSDEAKNCSTACTKKKCSQKCVSLPNAKDEICLCRDGFNLANDSLTCVDIDECKEYGKCSHMCKNTIGGFECSCQLGYVLDRGNNHTCLANDDVAEPILFHSGKSWIASFNLRTHKNVKIPIDIGSVHTAVGIDVDHRSERIFWTNARPEHQAIMSAKFDGSDIRIHANGTTTNQLKRPEHLAVDTLGGNVYYTDSDLKIVGVCTMKKNHCVSLFQTDVHKPRAIALYPQEGLLFFSDWGNSPHISRSGMDGAGLTQIIRTKIQWPNSITVDAPLKRIFWCEANLNRLESAKFDGSDRRTVLEHVIQHPFSVAVFEDTIFWADWFSKDVTSCSKFAGDSHLKLIQNTDAQYPMGIAVHHPVMKITAKSPCEGNPCSHLCLLAQGGKSFTCKCPFGMNLRSDRKTCQLDDVLGLKNLEEERRILDAGLAQTGSVAKNKTLILKSDGSREMKTTTPTTTTSTESSEMSNFDEDTSPSRTRVANPIAVIVGVCIGVSTFILVAVAVCWCYKRRRVIKGSPMRFPNPTFGLPAVVKSAFGNIEGSELKGIHVDRTVQKQDNRTSASTEESLRFNNKLEPNSARLEFINCSWSQPKLHAGESTPNNLASASSIEPMRRSATNPEINGSRVSLNPLPMTEVVSEDSDDGMEFDTDNSDRKRLLK